jgi:flagellar basal-body rod protein FlgF
MNIGLYQSASSLSALERWQEAVSQNIANSQVTGYKKQTIEFSALQSGQLQTNPGDRLDLGEGHATLFPTVQSGINFQPGESTPTNRDLDVAIQGKGFFNVQAADGSQAYTRAGQFQLRSDRMLTTATGLQVLNENGRPIQMLAQGGAISINRDGVVSQNGTTVGKIGVFDFADKSKLNAIGGGLFTAGDAEAIPVPKPDLLQAHLEESNVMPLREMVDLVTISRAYEANQKMITSTDDTMQKTLEALG